MIFLTISNYSNLKYTFRLMIFKQYFKSTFRLKHLKHNYYCNNNWNTFSFFPHFQFNEGRKVVKYKKNIIIYGCIYIYILFQYQIILLGEITHTISSKIFLFMALQHLKWEKYLKKKRERETEISFINLKVLLQLNNKKMVI